MRHRGMAATGDSLQTVASRVQIKCWVLKETAACRSSQAQSRARQQLSRADATEKGIVQHWQVSSYDHLRPCCSDKHHSHACCMYTETLSAARQLDTHTRTMPPRLMRWLLGNTSFISFAKAVSLVLGSLEVVIRILGSRSPACAYSSSMCVLGTAVLSSSSSTSCRSFASSLLSSVGRGFPSAAMQIRLNAAAADVLYCLSQARLTTVWHCVQYGASKVQSLR